MTKTITLRVTNNRLLFKCSFCQAKKRITLPSGIHQKSIRCHKCGELSHCFLNHRATPRESQTGKAIMIASDGRTVNIDLHDISPGGVGFEIPRGSRGVSLGQEVRLKCPWNARLLDQGRYVVRNIKGRRVGVELIEKKYRF